MAHLPLDSTEALGGEAASCTSRSLFSSRYADPTSQQEQREKWFGRLIALKAEGGASPITNATMWLPSDSFVVYARLQSRLLVNLAGGVMENAGMSLDRYGLPLIPGSAVKGCARRTCLAALREWCETDTKPEGPDNLFSSLCAEFPSPSAFLARICLTFGWVAHEWSQEKNRQNLWKSDLAWACNGNWNHWLEAASALHDTLSSRSGDATTPWQSLPNFAGTVAFLASRPNRDPGLVLDVVTPHHTDYHRSTDDQAIATDTEEPVPVLFPAVREQTEPDFFSFPLIPLRRAGGSHLTFAARALRTGLQTLGIGAKTHAGYGWFDASEELNTKIREGLAAKALAAAQEREQQAQAAAEAAKAAEAQQRKQEMAAMTPDERVAAMSEAQFAAKVRAFFKEPKQGGPNEEEKKAIITALKGPRLAFWNEFKTKATKGDLARSEQAIRQLNQKLNSDKMP